MGQVLAFDRLYSGFSGIPLSSKKLTHQNSKFICNSGKATDMVMSSINIFYFDNDSCDHRFALLQATPL